MKNNRFFLVIIAVISIVIMMSIAFKGPQQKKDTITNVFEEHEPSVVVASHLPHSSFSVASQLDGWVENPALNGSTISLSVRHAETGDILYSHQGDVYVHPASVMKLLTGAAALERLGSSYQFQTELYIDGTVVNGTLQGDVYVKGKGDPALTEQSLVQFAEKLKAKGIQVINGNLYGDDTWYDSVRYSQDLNWSDETFYTGAPISALTLSPNADFDVGTVIVEVTPSSKVGDQANIQMIPSNNYVTVDNQTRTTKKGTSLSMTVERQHGTNLITVNGMVPIDIKISRKWVAVWEPTEYALSVFYQMLGNQNIHFQQRPQLARKLVPSEAVHLFTHVSPSLEKLYIPFLKLSNNGIAEVLVKEMGSQTGKVGSWEEGLASMRETLGDLGMATEHLLLRDGSGMSHKNLLTANEVTKLLYEVQTKEWFPLFYEALPVAGQQDRLIGGTLRYRMAQTLAAGKVRAKTGALTGVSALAGYVETTSGETLLFSVVINNTMQQSVTNLLDELALLLVQWDGSYSPLTSR